MKNNFDNKVGDFFDEFEKASPLYQVFEEDIARSIMENHFRYNSHWVELGCGTGKTTNAVLSEIPDLNFISKYDAIDKYQNMLDQAANNIPLFGDTTTPTFELIKKDVREGLHYKDNTIDVVLSGFMIHNLHKDDRPKLFEEIYRVLKPGGLFINGDKYAHPVKTMHEKQYAWQMKMLKNIPELEKDWIEHYEFDNHPERIMHEDKYITQLQNIGFEVTMRMRYMMDGVISAIKR